jgi:integrase
MARLINRLTPTQVREITKPGFHPDGGCLYLQVSRWETKSWVLRYSIDGRTRWLGLGSANVVRLSEAREKARKARLLISEGIDPIERRRQAKDERRKQTADNTLFRDAVRDFLKLHLPLSRNQKHQWQVRTSLERVAKTLGARPISAVDAALINETLAPMWTKTPATAARIRQRIERVVQWVKAGRPLPTKQNGNATVRHHPALGFTELPMFMSELAGHRGIAARALEFTILTAARTGEVLHAQWSEIDLDAGVWAIPAERMKSGRQQRVPLSEQTLVILRALPRVDGSDWVFPGASYDKPLSHPAMLVTLKAIRQNITVHGFRSTFSDWARERTAYPRDVVEMALAHAITDRSEAAYRRGDMLDKRRKLMADFARYCYSPPVTDVKVVSIGLAR